MFRTMALLAMLVAGPLFLIGPRTLNAEQGAQEKPAGAALDPRLAPVKDWLDLLLIQPVPGRGVPLTAQDAQALLKGCPSILAAAPVVRARDTVSYGKRKWVPIFIYGTTPDYLAVRDWQKLAAGRPFTDKDVVDRAAVCLLGRTVARELCGGESPLGKEVQFRNGRWKVLGVLQSKGSNAMGLDLDDIVLLPWTTLSAALGQGKDKGKPASGDINTLYPGYPGALTSIYAKPDGRVDLILARKRAGKGVAEANRELTALLRKRHHIAGGQADDFIVSDFSGFEKLLKKGKR
jgi:hypothetical protein